MPWTILTRFVMIFNVHITLIYLIVLFLTFGEKICIHLFVHPKFISLLSLLRFFISFGRLIY